MSSMIGKIDEQRGWQFAIYSINVAGAVICLIAPGRYDVLAWFSSIATVTWMFRWRKLALVGHQILESERKMRGTCERETDAP